MPTLGGIHAEQVRRAEAAVGRKFEGSSGPRSAIRPSRESLRWVQLAILVGGVAAAGRLLTIYCSDCIIAWLGSQTH